MRRPDDVMRAILVLAVALLSGCARSGGDARAARDASSAPATRSLPTDTTLALPAFSAPVRIVTDVHGIPHVQAANLADLYTAWGFVTARDRLWQMLETRQSARGALWRWVGNRSLENDGGAQLFELTARATAVWARDRRDPALRSALEHYASGVNAWMDLCRRGAAPWPVELRRLGVVPDPWRPEDAYLALFGMGFLLDFDLPEMSEQAAIRRDGLATFLDRHRFESDELYTTIPDDVAARQWGRAAIEVNAPAKHAVLLPAGDPDAFASNVFAVGARRSASGHPLLANDPHLPLGTPCTLHAIHLSTLDGTVNAAGAEVPGLPAIVSGRNRTCAWGLTSLSADMMDVYADTLSRDLKQVRWNGGWATVREAPFTMRFKLWGPIVVPPIGQERRYTPHGPVVSIDKKRHIAYSVRWAGDDTRLTLSRLVGLERSASAAEIAERARTVQSPGMNIVSADAAGHVHYQVIGSLPRRGFVPGPGPLPSDGRHEWMGLVAPDSLPAWDVPPDSVVINCNNLPAGPAYFEPLPRFDWAQERALRIAERLKPDPHITLADLRSVQSDATSLYAERMLPLLIRHTGEAGELNERERAALDTLRAWDYGCRRRQVAPTLFRSWVGAFVRREHMEGLTGLPPASLDGRAPEMLRSANGAPEAPSHAARAALDTALVRLEKRLGPDMATWTWARAHRARFAHSLAWRDRDLQPRSVPMDGDNVTPSVGRSRLPWDVEVTHGPVWRLLVDLADPSRAWCVVAPGNASEGAHRTDLVNAWVTHAYVPLEMDWTRVEAEREGEWSVTPASGAR